MQGKMRERCCATIYSNLQKKDTEQTYHENTGKIYNDQIKTLMQLYLMTAPHSDVHSDKNKPRCMAKGPPQPEREVS